jgi:hypothetical protein
MEFTRERLHNYRDLETTQTVAKEIQKICSDIKTIILTTNESKYIYRISHFVKHGAMRPSNSPISLRDTSGVLKELLIAINNTFPDSAIKVDPLETYILIDWS